MKPFVLQISISVDGVAYLSDCQTIPTLDCTVVVNLGLSPPLRSGDLVEVYVRHEYEDLLWFDSTAIIHSTFNRRCQALARDKLAVEAGSDVRIGSIVVTEADRYLTRVIVGPSKVGVLERLAMLVDDA